MVAGLVECVLFALGLLDIMFCFFIEGPFFLSLFVTKICLGFEIYFVGLLNNRLFLKSQDFLLVTRGRLAPKDFLQLALTVQVVHLFLVLFEPALEGIEFDF